MYPIRVKTLSIHGCTKQLIQVVSCTTIFLFLFALQVQAQKHDDGFGLQTEIGTILSSGEQVPFWLQVNKDGIIDRQGDNGYTRLFARKQFQPLGPIDFSAGAELVGRLSPDNAFFLNQGWLQVDWRIFRLTAGRKAEVIGLQDTSLTSGSMIQSRNASPIPKVRIETPRFVEVPGADGWLSFKGYFSHGWMEPHRYVNNAYLHQKYLYLKVLPAYMPVQLYGGITHNVMWAGTHPEHGNLPDGLDDFWRVFSAQTSYKENAEPAAQGEAVGSGLGSYDFGFSFDTRGVDGLVYRQFYLETGAGAKFRNVWDGLWGISIGFDTPKNVINGIFWEHLYTKRQSSQLHRGDPPFGADSYYNNGTYQGGWVYRGRTIGNPLLFTDGVYPGVDNNIVIAHHVGLKGRLNSTRYRLFMTYSRNYGAIRTCPNEACRPWTDRVTDRTDQYLFMLESTWKMDNNLRFCFNLAYDTGKLFEPRFGVQVGLMYNWR